MRLTLPLSQLLRRLAMAFVGQLLFSFGNFLTVKADIGQAPWNAFQMGLGNTLSMTYGQATILVAFTVVAIDLLLREPIGLGTLMSALMVGGFYDFFDGLGLFPVIENFWLGLIVMLLGMAVMAWAQSIQMSACLGCGPRDAMMVGIGKHLRRMPIGLVSILLTGTVCGLGWLMGGGVGFGTVLFLLCNGAVMQLVFNLIHFEPRNLIHLGLHEMVAFDRAK